MCIQSHAAAAIVVAGHEKGDGEENDRVHRQDGALKAEQHLR